MTALVRTATPADVPAIAAIYGHAVRTSVATFDTADPPESTWLAKVTGREPGDAAVVVEEGGRVLGYAYAAPFRPRAAYQRTRETSIYLAPDATGRGLGRLTYAALLQRLIEARVHLAVAVVAQPNPASTALHESLGFELVGTLREVGWKFDRWVDTRWYQRRLEPPTGGGAL